ncbi:MAG: DNA alkylation repair protein [Rhodothermales bacterium]
MHADVVRQVLESLANPDIAAHSQRFFKTAPGEYGAGDLFRGIRVPKQREVARRFRLLPFEETIALLQSPYHEDRLVALFILVDQYKRGDPATRTRVYDAYLRHTARVNNWDLVDSSAHLIVGPQIEATGERDVLDRLAASKSLWERRIAMIATAHFIRQGDFSDALRIAETLVEDPEDLIHKAVGWMLREIGNRSVDAEEAFLDKHVRRMPRTMLRYAIEKFDEGRRQWYLRHPTAGKP